MNTIFDEKEYAEQLLSKPQQYIKARSLYILVKYYKNEGFNKIDTMDRIKLFCIQQDPDYNFILAEKLFKKLENSYKKAELKNKRIVGITQKELDIIKQIKDYKKEKILFTMLILSKMSHGSSDKYYINNISETVIFKFAKLSSNKEDRDKIIYELNRDGYISTPYDNSKTITINFVDKDGENIIWIENIDKMIDYYPVYCDKCGEQMTKISYKKAICDKCYKEKRADDKVNNNR